MYIGIFFALLGIFLSCRHEDVKYYGYSFETFCYNVWWALVGFIVGTFVIAAICPMDTYIKESQVNLETIQDGNGMRGEFFLGTGYIEGKMQYAFYYEEDGLYTLDQINAEDAKVRYVDGKPVLKIFTVTATDSWVNNFAVDYNLGNRNYIFEVPKGTIKKNMELDAK